MPCYPCSEALRFNRLCFLRPFAIIKSGIVGTYHHVSEHHLQRYLNEFDFRYSSRKSLGVNDFDRAINLLVGVKGKRLTYETTQA